MDWDKLKIFHAVAEAGSFTSATVNLNLSQSAISRQIQSLEHDLKVKLFERHARGLTLTENGEYVFKTAHDVITKLKEVETTLSDKKTKPSGKLTVTTVRSFGTHWLTPRVQEFMSLNPEIDIELIFDDKELDLSTRQADIGIFMRRPKQLNYIQKKLIDINYHIYGSNKYLEKNGFPKTVNELDLLSKDAFLQSANRDQNVGKIAIAYTVWSNKKGGGKLIVKEVFKMIKKSNHLNRLVTLSPLTEMARNFHLRNGAKLLQVNDKTQNFEYRK